MSKNKVNYPRVRCVTFLPLLLLIIAISLTFMPLAAFAGKKILVSSRDIKAGSTYLIGSGDMLEIIVWKEPELSRSVRVRPDGKISLPLVEDCDR